MNVFAAFPDWQWIIRNDDTILDQGVEHLTLTVLAVLIGMTIAFPLSIWAARNGRARTVILQTTGVLFTVPSLAVFVALVPVTGLSTLTALIPLSVYTLLILIRNTVAGLDAVPPDVVEAAEAMGFPRWKTLRDVQIPLALPLIFAGIRIATVTTIGLIVVTAVIGKGGWGQMMFEGFRRQNLTPTLLGFVLSVSLAVVLDYTLIGVQHVLTPWARSAER